MVGGAVDALTPPLDPEDVRLLALLARGMSGERLAREFGYSSATTRRRVHHLRAKTSTTTTLQAVVVAVRAGLV